MNEYARGLEIKGELRKAGADFLRIELDAALTFAQSALSAGDDLAKQRRDRVNARKGYDTILRFRQQFEVQPAQEFARKLRHLKSSLQVLGETDLG